MRLSIRSLAKNPRAIILDAVIVILFVLVVYLVYQLTMRHIVRPPVEPERAGGESGGVIQIDVLNACGIDGAASTWTSYLRSRGYDVVEMRNYRTFDVDESLVIDRIGNLDNARRVAYALGIPSENVIQQISEDYYVDVSVLIGKDYHTFKPSQERGTH
jgi:hypothetical protein